MIKKAQVKFIAIIMSILLGFFIVLSIITAVFLNNSTTRNVDRILNSTIREFELSNDPTKVYSQTFIAKIANKKTISVVSIDEQTFTQEQAIKFCEKVVNKPFSTGKEGHAFYKTVNINSAKYVFAIDITDNIEHLRSSLVKMFLIFLGVYCVLFVIVYLFSFSFFEPIKDAFVKQKQFVSNASHELKTPLTIISANADVLNQTQPNQWVDNIKSQTERMEILVSEMLEMAKYEEKKPVLNKENFNLSEEILKDSLYFDALAFEKGKTLDVNILPDIQYNGDKQSVNKIINILLDNAIKYASEGGIIKVALYKKNGKTILSVYNSGSNVPTEEANKIFQRFYRFDNSRSRQSGGSGLGLSIAKGIADANKWKISAVSKQNEYMIINVIF